MDQAPEPKRKNGTLSRARRENYIFINSVREFMGKEPLPYSQAGTKGVVVEEDLRFVAFWLARCS